MVNPAPEVDLELDLRMDLPDDDDEILVTPYTEAENTATKRSTQPELAENNEDPVYVITRGKEKEDAGINTNWGEVAPKVTGVPGSHHCPQPGRGQIPPGASWVQPSPD